MKQRIKNHINKFASNWNCIESESSIQNTSAFFAVLIAILTLRRQTSTIPKVIENYNNFVIEFEVEIKIIETRYPSLVHSFLSTSLEKNNFSVLFLELSLIFEDIDEDIDDLISWSYQFLKHDLEKAAFGKIRQNKAKIQAQDLLFTTQFFTDKYMVKNLVDEALSNVSDADVHRIVLIDVASGGGNFLIYSLDSLFLLYKKQNPDWSKQTIIDYILNKSILGYDLDATLSQIASLALFVKACSYSIPSDDTPIKIFAGNSNDKLGFLNSKIISDTINDEDFSTALEKIEQQGKIKIIVTNPPFMGKRDMDVDLKNYLLAFYPTSKADLCASFMQQIMQLMGKKDILAIVCQSNWMYLSSLSDFRHFFLEKFFLQKCIDLGTNAFEDINGEKTSVALCIIRKTKGEKSLFYNLKYSNLLEKKAFINQKTFPKHLTFELNQDLFLKNANFEFNYQLEHRFDNIEKLPLYGEFSNPMQGTSTGNNTEFVKFAWEVNGTPNWKLVSKGGGFSRWAGLNYYKVLWGENAEIVKANKGSALRNIDKIKTTQLVYSDTGTLGLNVRLLKENQVFIASGPGIQVLKGDKYAHLAFLNSRFATFLLKLINPKFTISAGYISKIPVNEAILYSSKIASASKKCLELKEKYLKNKLPNFEFEHLNYKDICNLDNFIEKLILSDIENDYQRLFLESEIESEIKTIYCFNEKEIKEINSVVGESPFLNPNKKIEISIEALDNLLAASIDVNCLSTSRKLNGFSIGSESIFENLSYKLDVNPVGIFDFIKKNIQLLSFTKSKYYNDLLHKVILKELGMSHISWYKFQVQNIDDLVEKMKSKYTFLYSDMELYKKVYFILNTHHKISFFNKPLITVFESSLTVGQAHHG